MAEKKAYSLLIVDDLLPNLRMLVDILKSDYTIHVAKNGPEAIRSAIEKQPDVILLDVVMPDMDGYEVITVLKSDERTRKIPVIFVTGLNDESHEEKGLALNAADYITKPFNPAIVRLRVQTQIKIISQMRIIESTRNRDTLIGIFNELDALVNVNDLETRQVLFLNDSYRKYYGIEGDCAGRLCHEILKRWDEPCKDCPLQRLRESHDSVVVWDHNEAVYDGILRKTSRIIDWGDGKKAHLEFATDITATRKLEKDILKLESEVEKVYYDPLTGIYSRRFFEENIKLIISSLSRAGSVLSLMMIDIDYFKKYNDTYGHLQGDECLKLVAGTIQGTVARADDFVARYGGEEFVVVLPNTGEQGARIVADKILNAVRFRAIPHEKSDVASHVTVSIGVMTSSVKHTHSREDYLKFADEQLYLSKESGRDRYTLALLEPQA